MKKLFLIFLVGCFSLGLAKPLPPGKLPTRVLFDPRAGQSILLDQIARQANQAFLDRMEQIPQVISQPRSPSQPYTSPQDISSFQVQLHSYSDDTSSALAIAVDEEEKGVMPSHMALQIKADPFARVVKPNGEKIVAPIQRMYITDKYGLDITVFDIPEEIKPFLTVLRPAKDLVKAGTAVNISGFAHENPTFLPEETVLSASPLRYIIQMRNPILLGGACGGAVENAATGEVIAMERGFSYNTPLSDWFSLLPKEIQEKFPENVHYAIPIQNAVAVARAFKNGDDKLAAIEMKVLGMPIALLYPYEHISAVELLRKHVVIKTVRYNPFLNPAKLEEFFEELQPNDVLSVVVERPTSSHTKTSQTTYYDINVSTGEVTKH